MKKKLSRILISRILSYFPHKKLHLIVVYSKVLQKYLEIPFENFKFYSSFRNNIYYQENMSSYYEFYLYNYPNIKKEIIKTALLEYLIIYSSNNKIRINNIHDFSVNILKAVKQNIVLDILSVRYHHEKIITVNNTNISAINIDFINSVETFTVKQIDFLFEKIIPKNLEHLTINIPTQCCQREISLILYDRIRSLTSLKTFYNKAVKYIYPTIRKHFGLNFYNLTSFQYFFKAKNSVEFDEISKFLSKLKNLEEISIDFDSLYDYSDFKNLVTYNKQTLKKITLKYCRLKADSTFEDFPNLFKLKLLYCDVPDNLKFIIPNCIKLIQDFYENDIDILLTYPNLTEISLDLTNEIQLQDTESLNKIAQYINSKRNLEKLSLKIYEGNNQIKRTFNKHKYYLGLSFVQSLKNENVTTLVVQNDLFYCDMSTYLTNFPNLVSLACSSCQINVPSINESTLIKMKELNINFSECISQNFVDLICSFPNLEQLTLQGACPSTLIIMFNRSIMKLTRLQLLDFSQVLFSGMETACFSEFMLHLLKLNFLKLIKLPPSFTITVEFVCQFISQIKSAFLKEIVLKYELIEKLKNLPNKMKDYLIISGKISKGVISIFLISHYKMEEINEDDSDYDDESSSD